ncbi:MAG TPA: insulinase family protein, partial [Vicinamibacterales bacterium]|nr:insulinase family protein [Vicinamibacterales bacterium]
VKAGSLMENDDQQGLAHFIEHMAFNGSAHFKSGEVFSYFESVGARLGPHVNAYTSFAETVFMLDLPSDKPEIIDKGLTAFMDFAGGLTISQEEVDKERGVVIEEWRGGLGASSRIRDKQFPVLFNKSRYAERLPIGKPDIIRTASPSLMRSFYDAWYRPDRMAVIAVGAVDPQKLEQQIKTMFGPLAARAPALPVPDSSVPLHKELLVNVVTDPEIARSSVSIERKRPRESELLVGNYRHEFVQRIVTHIIDERFGELARRPDARFLGAGVNGNNLSPDVSTFTMGAAVQDGKLEDGLNALATEAKRIQQFGFSDQEVDRGKRWLAAFYDRAYSERDKTDDGSFAREYLSYFLVGEPSPGIEYEYRLVQQIVPSLTRDEVSAMARTLLTDDCRVVLAVSPQKPGLQAPSDADLQAALASGTAATVTAWNDTTTTRGLMERAPAPAAISSRRAIDDLGVTIVKFANGLEAWLKPTEFKNDQIVFSMSSLGGASLAARADYPEASLAAGYATLAGFGGLSSLDIQKTLAGKLANAQPYVALSSHGIAGNSAPAQLETALQLVHEEVTAPGNDAASFALLKRQLEATVASRGRSPQQVFGEKVGQVNTAGHYSSEPLTAERVSTLSQEKMAGFYQLLFGNAADFTFFMVGSFKVDEAVPLLAKYIGTLPSTGQPILKFKDVGIHFPAVTERARVDLGREPRSQTVISFFADPDADPLTQEIIGEATTVLSITLRDILREDLGQTYTVSVGLQQNLPQRGDGHIVVRFGAAPENIESMTARVMKEIKHLQDEGPSADLTNRAKEAARRSYETALTENDYWMRRLQSTHMLGRDPHEILTRGQRIDSITPQLLQEAFKRYFPVDRSTTVTLMPAAQ